MLLKFIKIEELSTQLVGFYTIQVEGEELSEFEKFDEKSFPDHSKDVNRIYSILLNMGVREAKPYYFRDENGAHAIPGLKLIPTEEIENSPDFGIRLYCIRLTDNLVILLNGDVKTHQNPKQCPSVQSHFELAVKLAKLIDKAKLENTLIWEVDENWIEPSDEFLEI